MAPANILADHGAAEADPIPAPECPGEVVWPWHELDYALLMADADRILADALTPRAVVLLARVVTTAAGRRHLPPPVSGRWTVSTPVAPEIRATQRSPPKA